MELKDIKKLRQELIKDIQNLITNFEDETNLHVSDIHTVYRVDTQNNKKLLIEDIQIEL